MNALLIATGLGIGWAGNKWCKKNYPSQKPAPLPPMPGYKIWGYMGCPESRIKEIEQKHRNLFFVRNDISAPQGFALSRTYMPDRPFWVWVKDRPVVLQIEIKEDENISNEELWTDPSLISPQPCSVRTICGGGGISLYPALTPETQNKTGLIVRVHHIVTCDLQQQGGHLCRAGKALCKKITHRESP